MCDSFICMLFYFFSIIVQVKYLKKEYEDYPCEMTIKRWLSEYSKEDYYVWRDC